MTDGTDESEPQDDADDVTSMYEDDSDDDDVASIYGSDGDDDTADVTTLDGDTETDDDTDESPEPEISAPTVEAGGGELEEVSGTFYVKYAQEQSVTLHDIDSAQICTLIENPGFERHEIIEGTLKEQPPMGVSYLVEELEDHYSIPAERSPESPTTQVLGVGTEELDVGDALPIEREGKGEIHILKVEPSQTAQAVEELLDDETTYKNAARYDHVERVEVRTDEDEGVISIRYLP
jgi:hypothetical protein